MGKNSSILESQLYTCFKTEIGIFRNLFEEAKKNASRRNVRKLRSSIRRLKTYISIFTDNKRPSLTDEASSNLLHIWKTLGRKKKIDSAIEIAIKHDYKVKRLKRNRKSLKETTQVALHDEKIDAILDDLELMSKYDSTLPALDLRKTVTKLRKKLVATSDICGLRNIFKDIKCLLMALGVPIEDFKSFESTFDNYKDLKDLQKLIKLDDKLTFEMTELEKICKDLQNQVHVLCRDKLEYILFLNSKLNQKL